MYVLYHIILVSFDMHDLVQDISRRHEVEIDKLRLVLLQKGLTQESASDKSLRSKYLPSTRFYVTRF